jgi:hypothetical protein
VEIILRDVRDGDLPLFWAQMSDERAQHMAAVTRGYHYDRNLRVYLAISQGPAQ